MKIFLTRFSCFLKEKQSKGLFRAIQVCMVLSLFFATNVMASVPINEGSASAQQQPTITGQITDEQGEPIPGVNVIEKGTTNGTITDLDGQYEITVSSPDAVLEFSFIGYGRQEVAVGDQESINITLLEETQVMDEVVVVGYGSMERTNVTGAITSLKAEEIEKAPLPNFVEAMRGQVPGVRITRESGKPGSGVNFLVRGKNSLNSDNEPLIVIDGVPTTGGNLNEINPSDIANIDVLKDAAAASIYGASGANGVIMITTKEGKKGKPELNVKASTGITEIAQLPDLFSGEEYLQLAMDAERGADPAADPSPEDVLDAVELQNYQDGKSIDWHDELLRQGTTNNLGLSLSGGTEKLTYYMNADAYLEKGIINETSYDRYSFRLNTDYTPFDILKVGTKIQLSQSISDETGNTLDHNNDPDFTDFVGNSPYGRIYDDNGELVPTVTGDQFQFNPFFRYEESEVDRTTSRIYVNPYVEVNILDGLSYRLNTYAEVRRHKFGRFLSTAYNDGAQSDHRIETSEGTTYLVDNILNYKKTFANKHSVNATLVYGFQTFTVDTFNMTARDANNLLGYNGIGTVPQEQSNIDFIPDEWVNNYTVGRLSYGFDNRYIVTFTGRQDISSRFGENNRTSDIFPSVSFAWNAHNETFIENIPALSLFKYRVSYGTMGNDRIGSYGYIALTESTSYPFGEEVVSGVYPSNFANASLAWEESKQINTGIDFGLYRNRIYGNVDYYQTQTTALLLDEQIPPFTGFNTTVSNVGETKNQGVEANLSIGVFDGEFSWDLNMNWAKDWNEIVKLNRSFQEGETIGDRANGWFFGQDIDEIYDYKFIGIYQEGEEEMAASLHPDRADYGPGQPKIEDVDGDGQITPDDRTFLGNPTPDWYGGIRNTFSYKGIELSVLFEAVQGVTRINYFYGNLTGRDNQLKVDYWTPDNPSNEFPQPHARRGYFYPDAVRVRDASFVSLRNISLSYQLPQSLLQTMPVQRAVFYLRGNNLHYFTDYKDAYSPETNFGEFPITKTWSLGMNVTF